MTITYENDEKHIKSQDTMESDSEVSRTILNTINTTKNDDDHIIIQQEQSLDYHENQHKQSIRYFRLLMWSNFWFIVASVFYIWLEVHRFNWAIKAQAIPEYVLRADDDATWVKSGPGIQTLPPGAAKHGVGHKSDRRFLLNDGVREVPKYSMGGSLVLWKRVSSLCWSMYVRKKSDGNDYIGHRTLQAGDASSFASFSNSGPQQDEAFWNSVWENLDQSIQNSAIDLGYNASTFHTVQWREFNWNVLPQEIKQAALFLGFDINSWSGQSTVSVENLLWHELSAAQKNAANLLGYDKDSWNDYDGEHWSNYIWNSLSADVRNAAIALGYNATSWSTKTHWGDFEWNILPQDIKHAAMFLGYNETTWDNTNGISAAPFEDIWWDDLTKLQQNAAAILGHDKDSWNQYRNQYWSNYLWDNLPADLRNAASELGYNASNWGDGNHVNWSRFGWNILPQDIKQAALFLGYNKTTWDDTSGAVNVPVDLLFWDELSIPQQNAASLLGYDKNSWNYYENEDWNLYSWYDLPLEVQNAAMVLGYDQKLWDESGISSTKDLSWDDLTPEQKTAAAIFGYTEETWNRDQEQNIIVAEHIIVDEEQSLVAEEQSVIDEIQNVIDKEQSMTEVEVSSGYAEEPESSVGGEDNFSAIGYTQENSGDVVYWMDDDYIFQAPGRGSWVSMEMIIYFIASISFVIVGFLDLIREKNYCHAFMILAGSFGILSALFTVEDIVLSNIFNSISVHLYFLEGIQRLWFLYQDGDPLPFRYDCAMFFAHGLFLMAAFFNVVLSYIYFDRSSWWNLRLAHSAIVAACLWLTSALVCIAVSWIAKRPKISSELQTLRKKQELEIPTPEAASTSGQRFHIKGSYRECA